MGIIMKPDQKEITKWVEEKSAQIIADMTRICKIPSVAVITEDKQPPFGDECLSVLDEMLALGREHGFDTKNFDSCVGRIRYGNCEKSIGIWSHLDVVPAGDGWEHEPFEPIVENGYMIARGCQDNKSSAIIALYLLIYMKEHGIKPAYNLDAYMGTCEEQGMFDLDYYVEHFSCPELSLVPDSGFPVCLGERGSFNGELISEQKISSRIKSFDCDCGLYTVPDLAQAVVEDCVGIENLRQAKEPDVMVESCDADGVSGWRVICSGVSSHAAAPAKGKNALTALCDIICKYELADEDDCALLGYVSKINRDMNARPLNVFSEDEHSGPIILTVTQGSIREGKLVFGFISKYPVTSGSMDMRGLAEDAARENGFLLNVTRDAKPTLFDPSHPAVSIMTDTYNEVTGNNAKPFVMSGGTYARKLPRAFACGTGMPLPSAPEGMFAPGHGDYHQPDESISLERVKKALIIYIMGIMRICDSVEL